MPKWEYRFVLFTDKEWWEDAGEAVIDALNILGSQGWDIVNISADTGNGVRYLLKRKKIKTRIKE